MILPIAHRHGHPHLLRPRAAVQLTHDAHLWVLAPFADDPPPPHPPGTTPRLWEHEAVELFLTHAHDPAGPYLEVEVGPRGHHLVLRLRAVRQPAEQGLPLTLRTTHADGWWLGHAPLPPAWLPPRPWRALACRVHGHAPRHFDTSAPLPGAAPDFHQPAHWPFAAPPIAPRPDDLIHAAHASPSVTRLWRALAVDQAASDPRSS